MSGEYYCPFTRKPCLEYDCEWFTDDGCVLCELRRILERITNDIAKLVEELKNE